MEIPSPYDPINKKSHSQIRYRCSDQGGVCLLYRFTGKFQKREKNLTARTATKHLQ